MTCNLPIYIKRESQFVGIGTNQPGAALHVQGDIILAGQMFNAEGEPFSLGGGGGGSWKSRTSNLPLLVAPVAPGDGSGAAVIQVLSNVCLQKYGGNDNAYNIYTKALVVSAPSNRDADYKISLPDQLKAGVYATDTVIGEFWLRATSNLGLDNEIVTYKAVASVMQSVQDMAYVRFLSGTTAVSLGHFAAGNVLELNGFMSYATNVTANLTASPSYFIPGASVQWADAGYPHPSVYGGGGAGDFVISDRTGKVKYVGDDIAFKVDVEGTVAASSGVAGVDDYYMDLPYPVHPSESNAVVGDFLMRVTHSGTMATYRAYANVVAHTDQAVKLRWVNGTHDVSFYNLEVGSVVDLQGVVSYKTTVSASVAIPYDYIPNSLVQNSNGNIGVGTSVTPAKLTVGGDIYFTGGLYQNGVSSNGTSIVAINIDGNVGIGTGAPRDKLEVAGNILPSSNVTYDLGSSILRWRDLYLSGNTIDLGGTVLKRDEEGGGGIKVLSESGLNVDTTVRNLNASGYVDISGTRLERHVTGPLMVKTGGGDGVMESGMFKHVYVDGTANASNVAIITQSLTNPALIIKQYGTRPIADFFDADTLVMRIADGGNVGIGVANPLQKLHVNGNIFATGTVMASNLSVIGDFVTLNTVTSNTEQVVVENAGTGPALKVTQTGANSIAEFYDDGGALALKIADGGNVGIGTSNPCAMLDVNGNIHLTGSIYKNGEVFNSSVGDSIPIGTIMPFYSATVSDPSYLICNGGTYNRVDYIELANVLGVSPTATTFQVPDLRDKFLKGKNADAVGATGGSATKTLTEANMPAHSHSGTTTAGEGTHTHTITDPGHTHSFNNASAGINVPGSGGGIGTVQSAQLSINSATTGISINSTNSAHTHTFTTNTKGSGTAFDILPPYTTVIYIIKAKNNQYVTPIRDGDYWTNVSNKLIYQSGNVGIGTNNPQQLLDVNGNMNVQGAIQSQSQFLGKSSDSVAAPAFSWAGDTNVGIYRPSADTLGMVTNGVERMRVDANGNVGIGTANPLAQLHVVGSMIYQGRLMPMLDGSSSQNAAPCAKYIQETYNITTNGTYWINLPSVGATQVYCIMDPICAGGGWMMAYKATRGATFQYSSSYWTTTNTLNTTDTTRNDGDAKFHTANYYPTRDWLAIFPDTPIQGGDVPGGYGGWTWVEANVTNTILPVVSFYAQGYSIIKLSNGINYSKTEPLPRATPKYSATLWTPELGFEAYAINYTKFAGRSTRWGFAWNNEATELSNDNCGGIGLNTPAYSAGDDGYVEQSTGLRRSMRFEWYVR